MIDIPHDWEHITFHDVRRYNEYKSNNGIRFGCHNKYYGRSAVTNKSQAEFYNDGKMTAYVEFTWGDERYDLRKMEVWHKPIKQMRLIDRRRAL